MKVQCTSCRAVVKETEQICSYCRTPLLKKNKNQRTVATTSEITDQEREAFLSDRKTVSQNGSGCMVFILLPIITVACLWILL